MAMFVPALNKIEMYALLLVKTSFSKKWKKQNKTKNKKTKTKKKNNFYFQTRTNTSKN